MFTLLNNGCASQRPFGRLVGGDRMTPRVGPLQPKLRRKGLSAVWLVGTRVRRLPSSVVLLVAKAFRPFGWWGQAQDPRGHHPMGQSRKGLSAVWSVGTDSLVGVGFAGIPVAKAFRPFGRWGPPARRAKSITRRGRKGLSAVWSVGTPGSQHERFKPWTSSSRKGLSAVWSVGTRQTACQSRGTWRTGRKGLSAVWSVGTRQPCQRDAQILGHVAKAFRPFGRWGRHGAHRP